MRSPVLALAVLAAAAPACKGNRPPPASGAAHASRDAAPAHAHAPAATAAKAAAAPKGPLDWIDDNYDAALARARAGHKPIVIDMWAHWCHACLSMQNTVLTDTSFKGVADRYVWLALDTDKAKNAAAVAKFPVHAWPTYYVVNPDSQTVEARHIGSASVAGFRAFLKRGDDGYVDDLAGTGKLAKGSPLALARKGDRAATRGHFAAAAKAYAAALAAAPASWSRRPEVLVSRISMLDNLKRWKDCVALGKSALDHTGMSNAAADFASYAADCADHLKDAKRATLIRRLAVARISIVLAHSHALSVDDRADALRIQRETYDKLHQPLMARRLARQEQILLDQAAAKAPTPYIASTYNWPRAEVDVYLHEENKLVPDLVKSVAALPHEFDPPYRLAWVYYKLGKQDKATKMIDRAVALAYGPRKMTIEALAAKIAKARGDAAAEKKALTALIATAESLPPGQRNASREKQARAELAALGKGGGSGHSDKRGGHPGAASKRQM